MPGRRLVKYHSRSLCKTYAVHSPDQSSEGETHIAFRREQKTRDIMEAEKWGTLFISFDPGAFFHTSFTLSHFGRKVAVSDETHGELLSFLKKSTLTLRAKTVDILLVEQHHLF